VSLGLLFFYGKTTVARGAGQPAAIAMKKFSELTRLAAVVTFAAICFGLPAAAAWHGHPAKPPAKSNAMLPPSMGEESPLTISVGSGRAIAQIVVPADKSRIIHFDQSFSRVHVGSGDIAEVVPLSSSNIYVLGKKRGSTNLTLTNGANGVVAVVDVTVTYDVDGLRRQLAELLPTESIEIRPAGDAVVLSGHVSSADHLRTIMAVADRFAPGQVTNLLSLSGSQQVLLEVKFAEVQRSALLNMGLNSLNGAASNHGIGTPSLPSGGGGTNSFATIGGLLTDSKTYFLSGQINALEQSGMVRTLAEPNVVAMSGETASFLAGGEVPIPVVQSTTGTVPTTSIQYKDFGVGLSFTPTVISDDTVNLVLKSEVSAIDPSVSVTTSGISVPGFKVRRSTTTVELRNGQSFAIAGLIQNDFSDTLNALPGIGSIPILGALLRSTSYQRNQTELVVFITVHLVGPGPASNISLPTDRVVAPTAGQILGLGHTEETPPPAALPPAPSSMNGPPAPVAENAPAPVVNVAPASPPPAASEAAPPPAKVAELPPPANVETPPAPVVTEAAPPTTKAEVPPPAAPAATPAASATAPITTKMADVPPPAPAAVSDAPAATVTTPPVAATAASDVAPVTAKVADVPPPVAEAVTSPPPATPTPSVMPAPSSVPAASEPPAPETKVADLPAPAAETTPTPATEAAAAPVTPAPVAKPVAAKRVSKKSRLATAKPARQPARVAATKPAPKAAPPAADDLPVTAPANVQAPDSAAQPDSNGSTVP